MTRNVIGVEISRSDMMRTVYNSSFVVNMANFGILTELCTARKEEGPQILLHQEVDWSQYFCFIIDLSLDQVPLLHNYSSVLQSWTKVLGHFCVSGAFFNSHSSNPSPHPTNNVGRVYPEFFSEFQLCIGWGEGELQENFENAELFKEGTEK